MHYIHQLYSKKNWTHSHWCKINHFNHGFSTFDKWWYLFVMYNTKSYKKLVAKCQICEKGVGYQNIHNVIWDVNTISLFFAPCFLSRDFVTFYIRKKPPPTFLWMFIKIIFSMNLSHAFYYNWKYPLFFPWVKISWSTYTKVGWHTIECII
jgi:hypothetical protein